MRKVVFIFFLFLVIILVFYINDARDMCLDSSVCKRGLKVNTQYGTIEINKENCTKYNWIWNEKTETCQIK